MLLALYQEHEESVLIKANGSRSRIAKPPLRLLEDCCLFFGSTLQGRKEAAGKILHIQQKIPILLSEKKEILFFPTVSYQRKDCIWIHANAVASFHGDSKHTKLLFKSGDELHLPIAYRTIYRQMQRCEEFLTYLHLHQE